MLNRISPSALRRICLGSFALLIVLQALSAYLEVTQEQAAAYLVFGAKVLPLLAFGPFLWLNQKRAYMWMGFVLCLYFLEPVVDFAGGHHRALNGLLILDILLLFCALILFIRRYTEDK